jgi:hypothetical protein
MLFKLVEVTTAFRLSHAFPFKTGSEHNFTLDDNTAENISPRGTVPLTEHCGGAFSCGFK